VRKWLSRRPSTLVGSVAVLVVALGLVAIAGDLLGHLITGPFSARVYRDLDIPARNFASSHQHAGLTHAARRVGTFGNVAVTGAVAVVVGALWWLRTRNLAPALCLISGFVGAGFLTVAVKYAVNRTPASGPLPSFSAGTFPSGHELFAITVYGMLAVLAVRSRARWPFRWPLAIPLVVLAACIGAARVYLLDHFLSDVLGSVVLGVTWIVVVVVIFGSRSSAPTRS
jgi:membrane-associated phospholipid phosphatase